MKKASIFPMAGQYPSSRWQDNIHLPDGRTIKIVGTDIARANRGRNLRAAFGSIGNILGILIATLSLTSSIVDWFSLELYSVIELSIEGYRTVFHGLIDLAIVSWLADVFPSILVPSYLKDLVVLYFWFGNALRRALWPAFDSITRNIRDGVGYTEGIVWEPTTKIRFIGLAFHYLLYIILWPIYLRVILNHPVLYEERERGFKDGDFRRFRLGVRPYRQLPYTSSLERRFDYDIAIVLLLQFVTALLSTAILIAINQSLIWLAAG